MRPAAAPWLAFLAGGAAPAAGLAPGTGGIQGVVVDEAIRPVAGANVTLQGGGVTASTMTAEDGTFAFDGVPAGTHVLVVRHFRYGLVQGSVTVEAGQAAPVKLLVERLFSQEPYHETQKFDGFIQ